MDICIEHLEKENNQKAVSAFKGLKVWQRAYTDDRTVLTMAYNRLVE